MFTLASSLEHFWEPFWGPFWDQIGQRGGKMSPREPSGASKSQKAAFSKTLKNLKFFLCFWIQRLSKRTSRGPRRFPRDPQRDIQRWSKTWSKSGQTVNPKLSKKNGFCPPKYRSDRFLLAPFLRPWGFQKRLISKMSKNCSRCLKTVPK